MKSINIDLTSKTTCHYCDSDATMFLIRHSLFTYLERWVCRKHYKQYWLHWHWGKPHDERGKE